MKGFQNSNCVFLYKNKAIFTNGQLIFGLLFFIVFAIVIGYQYRKDLNLHKRYYKGTIWVLIAFIGFIAMIATVKFIFM